MSIDLNALDKRHIEAKTEFNATTRKRWYWKGNHKECVHASGVCIAKDGWCNSKSGAVVPQIAPHATGARFVVTIADESPNSTGDIQMGHQAKGFVPLEMEVVGGMKETEAQRARLRAGIMEKIRPSDEIVEDLRTLLEREQRATGYEEKHQPDRIDKDVIGALAKFDKANAKPKQEAARG